uniref:hypothetical protein n=1 Tax=Cellulomonas sp. URHD0024 TaxID=1302620 RepID=UPI0012DFD127
MSLRRRWDLGFRGGFVAWVACLSLVVAGLVVVDAPVASAAKPADPVAVSPVKVPPLTSKAPAKLSAPVPANQFDVPVAAPEPVALKTRTPKGFDEVRSTVASRGEKSTVYANPDGTFTTMMTTEPANVQVADGSWQPISTQVVPDTGGGGKVNRHPLSPRFAAEGNSADLLQVSRNGAEVSIGLVGASGKSLGRKGARAKYDDVLPGGVDLEYEVTPG